MSRFYVLGHDDMGALVSMTGKAFTSFEEASDYAETCNAGWTPFVVQAVTEPTDHHLGQPLSVVGGNHGPDEAQGGS